MRYGKLLIILGILVQSASLRAGDWPIYKGNIYFTGNNDEITVKNNNLKWLFQADDRVFNPVVSDGRVYFVDLKGAVYCIDEEKGRLIWKTDLKKIASVFRSRSSAAGKVKYPLIKDNMLVISDPIAIYALDKASGAVIWARTGVREEEQKFSGPAGRAALPMVDGIYADPIILDNEIYYGTRNMFISREIRNGHLRWDNKKIKTYSGFPSFYDELVFAQSMDFSTGRYELHCLNAASGAELWSRSIPKPMKIYPPVVYKGRIYVPSSKTVHCLDIKSGTSLWTREYDDYITSIPGFTDRAIVFSVGNSDILVISPEDGSIQSRIETAPRSSPEFVIIRDQIYIAHNANQRIKDKDLPFGRVRALSFDKHPLWEYITPFPGAVSQPIASRGILFLPAGNYLYALGTEYYARIVKGGDGYAVVPGKKDGEKDVTAAEKEAPTEKHPEPAKIRTRRMRLTVTDRDKRPLPASVEVTKREKGEVVYSRRVKPDEKGEIEVPAGDGVELLATAEGYVPRKEIIDERDADRSIELDKLRRGRGFVVDNIHFEFDKAYLKKESLDLLEKLTQIMKRTPDLRLEVRGHTDSTGDKAYNQKLSERRADAVAEYMVKNGVSPERLRAVGFGDSKPIASNSTPEGRAKNRRTEFYFPE